MPSIVSGLDSLIDEALGLTTIGATTPHYRHRGSYRRLAGRPLAHFNGPALVGALYCQIEKNWGHHKRKGSVQNWRWQPNSSFDRKHRGAEIHLERDLIGLTERLWPGVKDWVNQVPTASSLMDATHDRHRAVDLVHRCAPEHYEFIELKVGSDTPLYAAMEVLHYGLLYVFSRQYRGDLHYTDDRPLLKARRIDLKVLAPAAYYGEYRIDWLIRDLNRGLEALVIHTGTPIEMTLALEILEGLLERRRLGAIGPAASSRASGG